MSSTAAALGLPPDAEARQRALDPITSFVVRAPAGSGKTEILIRRFLRLLAVVERPEQIEALTFTRKAAAEMRHRLLKALGEAGQPEPEIAHERATWRLATAARERDRALGWGLMENPSRLHVSTLDALARRLAGLAPWASGVGILPEPSEDASALYPRAAGAVIARVDEAGPANDPVRRLLDHFDADTGKLRELLAGMMARRHEWLAFAGVEGAALRGRLEENLRAVVEVALATCRRALEGSGFAEEIVALAAEAAGHLNHDPARSQREIEACLGMAQLPPAEAEALPQWRGIAAFVLTGDDTPRKTVDVRQGATPAMRERFRRIQLRLEAIDALAQVRCLPEPRYSDRQWEVVEAVFGCLGLAEPALREAFADAGRVDFEEIGEAALAALGTDAIGSPLAYELDASLRHLLVDEFQDTSRNQFELLRRLTREWTAGDGRTLFAVGDPAQSIYGFRRAEVGLFLRVWDGDLANLRIERLELSANFRSQPGLVAWFNDRLRLAFPAIADIGAGAVPYAESVPMRRDAAMPAAVTHRAASVAEEAAQVAELAASAQGSVAILARQRGHLRAILPELERRQIRYDAARLFSLAESAEVRDLLALTRAIYHLADRVAWLAVLRAPWCGLRLADLETLCADDDSSTALQLLAARGDQLSADGRARVEGMLAVVRPAIEARLRVAPRPILSWCRGRLRLPANAATEAFLKLLERLDGEAAIAGDVAELDRLTAEIENLYAPVTAPAAQVTVLTMHQSKGLEFDVVIVPALHRFPRSRPGGLLAWTLDPFLLAAKPERNPTPEEMKLYQFVARFEAGKRTNEQLRVAYVACTRARRELHLLARPQPHPKTPRRDSLLSSLWPAVGEEFVVPEAAPEATEATATAQAAASPPPLRRYREPLPATPGMAGEAAPEPASAALLPFAAAWQRQVGTAVHAVLRQMAREAKLGFDPERLRAELRAAGVAPSQERAAFERAALALERTVADERGRWILAARGGAWQEVALDGIEEGELRTVILDRMFVENGVRWIVDYKTAFHEGGEREAFLDQQVETYRPQMRRYARFAAGLEPRLPIRCGLYFPWMTAWREWTP